MFYTACFMALAVAVSFYVGYLFGKNGSALRKVH